MIKELTEYIAQDGASNLFLYEKIKIIKAKSSDSNVIDILNDMENVIKLSIYKNKKALIVLKNNFENYSQQFSKDFNLLHEVINDNFLILSKLKNGYHILLTNKAGETIKSKTYVEQIDAIKYFIELFESQ